MWCYKCGQKLPDGSNFCFNCGAKVLTTDDTELDMEKILSDAMEEARCGGFSGGVEEDPWGIFSGSAPEAFTPLHDVFGDYGLEALPTKREPYNIHGEDYILFQGDYWKLEGLMEERDGKYAVIRCVYQDEGMWSVREKKIPLGTACSLSFLFVLEHGETLCAFYHSESVSGDDCEDRKITFYREGNKIFYKSQKMDRYVGDLNEYYVKDAVVDGDKIYYMTTRELNCLSLNGPRENAKACYHYEYYGNDVDLYGPFYYDGMLYMGSMFHGFVAKMDNLKVADAMELHGLYGEIIADKARIYENWLLSYDRNDHDKLFIQDLRTGQRRTYEEKYVTYGHVNEMCLLSENRVYIQTNGYTQGPIHAIWNHEKQTVSYLDRAMFEYDGMKLYDCSVKILSPEHVLARYEDPFTQRDGDIRYSVIPMDAFLRSEPIINYMIDRKHVRIYKEN